MNLKITNTLKEGYNSILDNREKNLRYLEFGILKLKKNQAYHRKKTRDKETVLVILGGSCSFKSGWKNWENLGKRKNVFDDKATSIYLPPGNDLEIKGNSPVEIAVIEAASYRRGKPLPILPQDVIVLSRGKDNWFREIHNIAVDNVNAERLLVGETFNFPGNWSSFPPHKHDEDNLPQESKLEEIYFYKIKPENGFGIQRVYSSEDSLDEVYVVENNDLVIIPRGYHPVVAAPGCNLYYLWALAGEKRIMKVNEDPRYTWIKDKP